MSKTYEFCNKRDCCPKIRIENHGATIFDEDRKESIFLNREQLADLCTFLKYNSKEIINGSFFEYEETTHL